MGPARYDTIGSGYASNRREDPQLRDRIARSLGDARSVVNVGAGTGSYEPRDRLVVAIEPSVVMISQRPADAAPVVQASASRLPLRDGSIDAAMAVLTVHHWDDGLDAGLAELRRVARGPVVVVTYDADVSSQMWLVRDYLPELAALDRSTFPSIDRLARALGGDVEVQVVPTPHDTPDWTLGSFWAHPERVLDASARSSTSGLARMAPAVIDRLVTDLRRDLDDGTWDQRHGHLREQSEFDSGMRLLVARPERTAAEPSSG
jgi:SAM-dependent methyltransferase